MVSKEECIQKFKDDNSFRLNEKSIQIYVRATEQMLLFCNKPYTEITSRDIRGWMISLETSGYKHVTIKGMLFGIKKFYHYCMEEGILSENPISNVTFPKVEEKLPKYLKHDELEKLRHLANRRIDDRAIVETLYATGIRISELITLEKGDINWSERIIHIKMGKRKKDRIVLFTPTCAEYLKRYLDERDDELPHVFLNSKRTGPLIKRTIQLRFSKYAEELLIPMSAHTLRHTFAAHLAIKGMPLDCIQVLLGHIEPQQTHLYARLYSDARKQKYDEWM